MKTLTTSINQVPIAQVPRSAYGKSGAELLFWDGIETKPVTNQQAMLMFPSGSRSMEWAPANFLYLTENLL